MKKSTIKKVAGLAFMVGGMFAVQSSQAVLFDFNNGNDLDGAGINATMTVDALTLTTTEIIGWDGSLVSEGATHYMNSTSANSLGVNSSTTPPNAASDARDFDPGEAWVFKFDKDVELNLFNFSSLNTVAELTMSSSAFTSDFVFHEDDQASDDFDMLDTIVTAGTTIMIQNTSAESTALDSHDFRITEFEVTVIPEPATLGLLGACAIGAFALRRFRM